MNTNAFFPCQERLNLILETGRESHFFPMNSSHCQLFSPNCQKAHFGKNKYHYPPRWNPYMVCHTMHKGSFNFPWSTNKINFLMKFPHLEKIVDLMKDLKYEHQSIFPWGVRVKLNFRDRYRNHIFVYQIGTLCEGAHEISGIPAPLCLCGWVIGGFMGWVMWWVVFL